MKTSFAFVSSRNDLRLVGIDLPLCSEIELSSSGRPRLVSMILILYRLPLRARKILVAYRTLSLDEALA